MKALLLAAGLGTRLAPLTNFLPKCLAPIGGRPLLDIWLENLVTSGIENIVINTHKNYELIDEYLNFSYWGRYVSTSYESALLGTGGSVLNNAKFMGADSFLVCHLDNLLEFNVLNFVTSHRNNRPEACFMTMLIFETDRPSDCGVVLLNEDRIVTGFYEKVKEPPSFLANGAIYIFEPQILDRLKKLKVANRLLDISNHLLPQMVGEIFTVRNDGYLLDIGTMNEWRRANKDFPPKKSPFFDGEKWDKTLRKFGLSTEYIDSFLKVH